MGLSKTKIMARKCEVTNSVCGDFLDRNHIQPTPSHIIRYFNLVYDNEIVGSMTASRHHRQNAEGNPIILSRLCFKDGVTVQGGASKLFKH